MTAATLIKTCRAAAKMSQDELAVKLGVARPRVSEWENEVKMPATATFLRILAICGFEIVRVRRKR